MKKLIVIILTLAAIGAGAGAYYNYRRAGTAPDVLTAPVTRGAIVESVGATGALEAVTTVQVGTQVSGTIKELHADFNSIVQQGQVIARLDPSLFETQIDQMRANLARAEADVERLRVTVEDAGAKLARAEGLAEKKLIAQSELETAQVTLRATQAQLRSSEAQVTQARAALNQTEVNLEHTVISSPIDGIVISRNVDIGQTVAASMQAPTLFVLAADLSKMKVNANIDEADVGRIRPRQRVRFRVDAFPAEDFVGTVLQVRLQPVVVQNVVTYATVIDVPNPDLKLKPGMTANVTIEIARRDDATRIPNAALRFRPNTEIYAALGQEPAPEMPRGELRGDGPGARMGSGPAATAGAPATPPTAATPGRSRGNAAAGAGPSAAAAGSRAAAESRPATAERSRQMRPASGGQAPGMGPGRPGGFPGSERGGAFDPERRRELMARLDGMPPEQRERILQRMRERGFDPGGPEPIDRAAAPPAAARPPAAPAEGRTIDSLFGPLPPTESSGRVFLYVNGQLKPVRVRLGISDGSFTELLSGELPANTEVVTGVVLAGANTAATGGRSPLMPGRPGFRGPGGMPGGAPH